jgi:hypothetical protein
LIIRISEYSHRNDKRADNCYCEWFHQGILQFEFIRPLHLIPAMRDPVMGSRLYANALPPLLNKRSRWEAEGAFFRQSSNPLQWRSDDGAVAICVGIDFSVISSVMRLPH